MASIEYRETGEGPRWRVVWREHRPDGRRTKQQRTYNDPQDAEAFRAKVEAYGNQWPPGEDPRPTAQEPKVTFGEWAETAIEQRRRANERTKADYRRDMRRHFAALADVPVADLTQDRIDAWLAERRAADLSPKTIRNLHGFGSSLLIDAMNHRPPLADHNPFGKLPDMSDVRTEEMVFLTHQEFATVLAYVREEYRPLIRFLAGTGMRYGEATALTVRDIEILGNRKTATVTKAWKRTGPANYVIGEPKTQRSRRTISLSPELVDLLVPLVAGKRGVELVFSLNGLRLPHSEVYKRGWAPAVARANVCDGHYEPQRDGRGKRPRLPEPCSCAGVLDKTPRIHDLRHTHASWLIADGLPLPAISRRLGHSSITITIDRYGHLDPSLDARIDAAVDKALRPELV